MGYIIRQKTDSLRNIMRDGVKHSDPMKYVSDETFTYFDNLPRGVDEFGCAYFQVVEVENEEHGKAVAAEIGEGFEVATEIAVKSKNPLAVQSAKPKKHVKPSEVIRMVERLNKDGLSEVLVGIQNSLSGEPQGTSSAEFARNKEAEQEELPQEEVRPLPGPVEAKEEEPKKRKIFKRKKKAAKKIRSK